MDKLSVVIILSLVFLMVCLIIIIVCISIRNERFGGKTLNLYGLNYPRNGNVDDFKKLLKHWNHISQKYDIPYSLAWGSLLGCYRNKQIIPWDWDLDIFIDGKGIDKILSINQDWCIFNTDLSKYDWKIGEMKLVINKFHNKKFGNNERKRFNCDGKEVPYNMDACSFNGLFARLVYKKGKHTYLWLDLFTYNQQKNLKETKKIVKQGKGKTIEGDYLDYIQSIYATPLPPLKKSYLEGIPTYIFKDSKSFLKRVYGKNFLIPDKKWNGRKWVP